MARTANGLPGIYNSSPITLSSGDGAALALTASGYVIVANPNGSNVGASTVDGSTFTAGSDSGGPIEGVYQSTPSTVADGKYGVVGIDTNRNLKVTEGTALSKTIDSIVARVEATTTSNISASTSAIRTGTGILRGMYVNSTSSGTIKIYDNTAQSGTILNNTITPAIGWHNLGDAAFATGLSVTIGSTLDVTLYYIPTP